MRFIKALIVIFILGVIAVFVYFNFFKNVDILSQDSANESIKKEVKSKIELPADYNTLVGVVEEVKFPILRNFFDDFSYNSVGESVGFGWSGTGDVSFLGKDNKVLKLGRDASFSLKNFGFKTGVYTAMVRFEKLNALSFSANIGGEEQRYMLKNGRSMLEFSYNNKIGNEGLFVSTWRRFIDKNRGDCEQARRISPNYCEDERLANMAYKLNDWNFLSIQVLDGVINYYLNNALYDSHSSDGVDLGDGLSFKFLNKNGGEYYIDWVYFTEITDMPPQQILEKVKNFREEKRYKNNNF